MINMESLRAKEKAELLLKEKPPGFYLRLSLIYNSALAPLRILFQNLITGSKGDFRLVLLLILECQIMKEIYAFEWLKSKLFYNNT